MSRRTFVYASAGSLLVITITIAGLAFFSNFAARAFMSELPYALHYLPADTQAVFGMNVQKFVASPIYAKLMLDHEQKIGSDLAEFTAKTGVDPRQDVQYVIAAGRGSQQKGSGVVIAVGNFKPAVITSYIQSQTMPIQVDYKGAEVLMFPEANGAKLEKGIAFLSDSEIALGDLESLHAVLDVRYGSAPSIDTNTALTPLLGNLSASEMFWFAGDAASILSKAPANAPLVPTLSAVQSVFGSLNLSDLVVGKITITATDEKAAGQLADFVNGLLALGKLASAQNVELAQLVQGVQITQRTNQFDVSVSFPLDLLQKLEKSGVHVEK